MAGDDTGIWNKIFDGLKGHPEATLAATAIFFGGAMAAGGVNLLFAAGLPIAIYTLYLVRMARHDRAAERLAEIDVERIEKGLGATTRQRGRRALERKKGHGKP